MIIDNGSAQLADLGTRANPQNRLADLNPADIERIEIIRGAAAAALYGSRANNGVVQIFTKKWTIGKPRFGLNVRYATNELRAQQPFNFYPYNEAGLPVQRYNYQDDIFQRAPASEANLTVEGGNDQTRYFISGNFSDEDGIMRSTSSRRAGARINLQQQLSITPHRQRHGQLRQHAEPVPGLRRAERLRDHGVALLRADQCRLPSGQRDLSRSRRRWAPTRCWPSTASATRRSSTASSGRPS